MSSDQTPTPTAAHPPHPRLGSPPRRWPRRVAVLLSAPILGLIMLRWFEHHQVFHPSRTLDTTGRELRRPVEDIWLETPDGIRLHAWFFPAEAGARHDDQVWLLLHGNAGNISHRLSHAELLLKTGAAALLLDYRGYGRSQGRPSEVGTYLDAETAYHWLRQRGFAANHIFALGESLGGGVASELARRQPLGGLVLLSSFTSVPDVAARLFPWLPVRRLASIRYDTHSKLPHLQVPVLILHGRQDSLIPFEHAEQNFAAAAEPKRLVPLEGDHNDLPQSDAARYTQALQTFLENRLP